MTEVLRQTEEIVDLDRANETFLWLQKPGMDPPSSDVMIIRFYNLCGGVLGPHQLAAQLSALEPTERAALQLYLSGFPDETIFEFVDPQVLSDAQDHLMQLVTTRGPADVTLAEVIPINTTSLAAGEDATLHGPKTSGEQVTTVLQPWQRILAQWRFTGSTVRDSSALTQQKLILTISDVYEEAVNIYGNDARKKRIESEVSLLQAYIYDDDRTTQAIADKLNISFSSAQTVRGRFVDKIGRLLAGNDVADMVRSLVDGQTLSDEQRTHLVKLFGVQILPQKGKIARTEVDDDEWRNEGRCRSRNPEDFFSDSYYGNEAAKRECIQCDVRAICLHTALARDEPSGIWGGLSAHDRVIKGKRLSKDVLFEHPTLRVVSLSDRLSAKEAEVLLRHVSSRMQLLGDLLEEFLEESKDEAAYNVLQHYFADREHDRDYTEFIELTGAASRRQAKEELTSCVNAFYRWLAERD